LRFADRLFRLAQWAERAGTVGHNDAVAKRFRSFGNGSALVFPPGAIFGEQFIEIGAHTLIGPYVTMSAGLLGEDLRTPQGWSLRFGDNCSIGRNSFFVSRVGVEVGNDVTMGPNVYVTDHNHRYDDTTLPIKQQWMSEAPVSIGPGCWLGAGAVILPGARLGRNVVVAAGSVVRAGDIPDFSVVAGVPAKVVRSHDADGWDPPLV
jgi:acetyltransferase-like isoleucine patch superfamily enzyme